ncbi:type VI secretion system membrane subunit TssM [Pseudomonas fulva]|uniref:type VI secretion system membrane subunit TssM n=1 Tax=Pseudomonas fulva TaxID=47880 RepID=UPI00244BB97B|nr:type VI secretion system membrane subunit TssM [Pseudomonas fulva]MDH0620316.1 type VI secretion system membrane subunit TssM [Pseudomonas fulva]
MNNFFRKTWAFLTKTWVWTLLLVLLTALLVWFVGPLLAIADNKFWEDSSSRLLTIAVLFLLWGLLIVFASWRGNVRKKEVAQSETGQADLARRAAIENAERTLRERFKDALRTLRTSSLYRGRSERWRNDLPWYLVIGPQGAGKTSLLDFSGLEFPINKVERKLSRDVSSTAYCDWYFAENGVLIDTSGRYVDQNDSDIDGAGWSTLLGLLRSRRRTRPLNGVLITVPVTTLLSGDREGMVVLGRTLRDRLQEIQQQLHADVPVYLVLTKADKILGFDAFFDQLAREESEQVLGASFGKEQNGADVAVLNHEFEDLLSRLGAQVITRIHQERDAQRRGLILDFPLQLGQVVVNLGMLVDAAFTGNRYQRASTLRGFYFTSAPHTNAAGAVDAKGQPLPVTHSGRTRFIYDLMTKVVFPEAALAGLDKRETSRIKWRQRALYAGALCCMGLFGLLWAGSFAANDGNLEKIRAFAERHGREGSALTDRDDDMAILPLLDNRYAATQVFPAPGDASYAERGGLYQGDETSAVLLDAYNRELIEQLLPRVAQTLEMQIRSSMGNRERLLASLRAYLMLNIPDRRDNALLKEWMATQWSGRYPGNTQLQNDLNTHFERLLALSYSQPLNDPLVAQAREVLRRESLVAVVYRVLREQARSLPEYRLGQHTGPQGAVFAGTDYVIPGFYTHRGYQQYFIAQGSVLMQEILRDNWVLGEGGRLSGMDMRNLLVQLEQSYFKDYANYWSEAIGQVRLATFTNSEEGANQLASLSAANSPLLLMLAEVRENTRFPAVADAADVATGTAQHAAGKLGNVAAATAGAASQALAKRLPDTSRKALERRFESLHRLLDEDNGPTADLVPVLQALNDLQLQLLGLARSSQPELAAFEVAKGRIVSNQRDPISTLRNTANRLPRPVSGWFSTLAEDSWMLVLDNSYEHINQRYETQLYNVYSKTIDERYPFHAHSSSDVALNDFREFFKVQGIADRFFDTYLRPFVIGDPGSYRLRVVDGRSLPVSREFLDQMNNVQTIQRGFFADNPNEPQVQFKLEPYTLDSTVGRAEFRFGEQQMVYRHGPIIPTPFKWPSEANDGRTSLALEGLDGKSMVLEKNTGPWSLFRLFDLMHTEYQSGRDVLMIKASVGGMRVNYLVLTQRSPNPFDLSAVRNLRMPVVL